MARRRGITCPHCGEFNPSLKTYRVGARGAEGRTIFVDQKVELDKDNLYCSACGKDLASNWELLLDQKLEAQAEELEDKSGGYPIRTVYLNRVC